MTSLRALQVTTAGAVLAVGSVLTGAPALAAPASVATPAVEQYAPPTDFGVALSLSVVVRGGQVVVLVDGTVAGRPFEVQLLAVPLDLGTVIAGPNGDASTHFPTGSLPPGQYTVQVTAGDTGEVRTAVFTVVTPGGGGASGSGPSASGGLAFTGSNAVVPLGVLGVVLLGGGAGAVVASRRRRSDDPAT